MDHHRRKLGPLAPADDVDILAQADGRDFFHLIVQFGMHGFECFGGVGEEANVLFEVVQNLANHAGDGFQPGIARLGVGQVDCQTGHGIQHAAHGMARLREKGAIEHGSLEHGNLQARNLRFQPVGQGGFLEDHIEQHGHGVDQHSVERARGLHHRALLKHAQDIAHGAGLDHGQFEVAAIWQGKSAHLQLADGIQQAGLAHRAMTGRGRVAAAGIGGCRHAACQLFEQPEHVVAGRAAARLCPSGLGQSGCGCGLAGGAFSGPHLDVRQHAVFGQVAVDALIDGCKLGGQYQIELVQQHDADVLFDIHAADAFEQAFAQCARPQGVVVLGEVRPAKQVCNARVQCDQFLGTVVAQA